MMPESRSVQQLLLNDPNKNLQRAQIWQKLKFELYSNVRKLVIVSQILACAPIDLKILENTTTSSRKRRLLLFLHIIWCIFLYIILATLAYIDYTELIVNLPRVQKPLYFFEYLAFLLHTLLIIVYSYRSRHKFQQFLNAFVDFDCDVLHEFHSKPEYQRFRRFSNIHFSLMTTHLFVILLIVYFQYGSKGFWMILYTAIGSILPNAIIHASLLQYYGLLNGVIRRTSRLNEILQREVSLSYDADDTARLHHSLGSLRRLSSHLEIFTSRFNNAFGPSILLVYFASFVNISVGIFLLYKFFDDACTTELTRTLFSVLWTLTHMAKMFLVLFYNHRIQTEKNTTAMILNSIKSPKKDLEETITRFVLQLSINTRSNVVCSVLTLNLAFIKSFLLSVATLFIFLLEYDISFETMELS